MGIHFSIIRAQLTWGGIMNFLGSSVSSGKTTLVENSSRGYLRKGGELLVLGALVGVLVSGCGGGGSGGATGGNVASVTIAPFKGPYSSGTVTLKDANGNVVPLISGGTINTFGVAALSYDANVTYPVIVEVSGVYFNEVSGTTESAAAPLRGIITGANSVASSSAVPVTIVTEVAVADLQNRLGGFGASTPITAQSAVAALNTAGTMLGIPATTVPSFDAETHLTADAGTLRLAALSIVADSQSGTTLVEKSKSLASGLANLGANAPTAIISQAAYDNALLAVAGGASNMMTPGATMPETVTINTTSYDSLHASLMPTNVAMVWNQAQAAWDNADWQ